MGVGLSDHSSLNCLFGTCRCKLCGVGKSTVDRVQLLTTKKGSSMFKQRDYHRKKLWKFVATGDVPTMTNVCLHNYLP